MERICVLVAEDNPDLRDLYHFVLKRAGFDVREAEDGEEAIHALEGGGVDLLLTDLMMPEVNGLELIRRVRLRREFERLPIIVASAYADGLAQAARLGATQTVLKPTDPDDLLDVIMHALPDRNRSPH